MWMRTPDRLQPRHVGPHLVWPQGGHGPGRGSRERRASPRAHLAIRRGGDAGLDCSRHMCVMIRATRDMSQASVLPSYLRQSCRTGSSPAQRAMSNPGSWPGERPGTAPPVSHVTLPAWQQHVPIRYTLTTSTDVGWRAILSLWGNPTVSAHQGFLFTYITHLKIRAAF